MRRHHTRRAGYIFTFKVPQLLRFGPQQCSFPSSGQFLDACKVFIYLWGGTPLVGESTAQVFRSPGHPAVAPGLNICPCSRPGRLWKPGVAVEAGRNTTPAESPALTCSQRSLRSDSSEQQCLAPFWALILLIEGGTTFTSSV